MLYFIDLTHAFLFPDLEMTYMSLEADRVRLRQL